MRRCVVVSSLVLLTAGVTGIAGQERQADPLPSVELAVNLERMKRRLADIPASEEERSLLKLDYYVSVYGRAPAINVLEGFDLHNGPVPFGPPTHDDFQALWTPEGFDAPVADLTSILGWLLKR
tara:strand:- start:96 stop:467 length:372 start_codon:yes stop_codon:yes gene_type:complete